MLTLIIYDTTSWGYLKIESFVCRYKKTKKKVRSVLIFTRIRTELRKKN